MLFRSGLDLTDVTCGGATSTDLTESQTPPNGSPVPPQLDALSSSTDLVTIGMGGNDGKVFSELVTTCVGKAAKDRDGAPCTAEGASFRVRAERQIGKLPTRMVEAIEAVRERAPEATIIVVGSLIGYLRTLRKPGAEGGGDAKGDAGDKGA